MLATQVAAFEYRREQTELATAIEQTLADRATLVTEAGTGTGKTFAYLVPAMLLGQRVIVSTGTKALQDQLFERDIPTVRAALSVPVQVAVLKGRSNYLCPHRLKLAAEEGRGRARIDIDALSRIRDWAGKTRSGDIAELGQIDEGAPIWPAVTSTADNCLGLECPQVSECFLLRARRQAQQADLVVINHHLLLADMALRDDGFGELLPEAAAFVVDEAHQLPDVAAQFFGLTMSSRQLQELARDVVAEQLHDAPDMRAPADAADALRTAAADLRIALGGQVRRAPWQDAVGRAAVQQALTDLHATLERLEAALAPAAPRGKGLDACWRRCQDLRQRLAHIATDSADGDVQWFEVFTRAFALHRTPMEVSRNFLSYMESAAAAWVFTSATLAVGGGFEHFTARLGLEGAVTRRWDSPFDFTRQALLYLPAGLPFPDDPAYTEATVAAAVPVLEASRGRAFFLFTSHRALQRAAALLRERIEYPLLVQGSAPRHQLLERFRALGNAVLLGTSSFWEGVDVRGSALSCVIIEKLPFAAPDDPILQARIKAMREAGGNPFMQLQVPNAVIALKQGAGRLIRGTEDRGVLMLCDPRLLAKPYGRIFLDSLPPMRRTRDVADVEVFFADTSAGSAAGPAAPAPIRSRPG